MKTQLAAVVAALSAMAAGLTLEQPDQRGMDSLYSVTNPTDHGLLIHVPLEMDLLANTDGQGPMSARMSRPFPFSNPHTVEPRGLGETSSFSSVVSFETQDPVSAAAPAVTDGTTGSASPPPSPSASTPADYAQPDEVGDAGQSSPVSPGPEVSQDSGPTLAPEAPEAEVGSESSHEAHPAPTGYPSAPAGEGQITPTEPCDPVVSASAASSATNQSLTTIVVQPAQQTPSTTLPLGQSGTQSLPKATETGPVQTSAGSRSWALGVPATGFAFGLLGVWLVV